MPMTLEQLRFQLSEIESSEGTFEGIGAAELPLLEQLFQDEEPWMASRAVFAASRVRDRRALTLLSRAVSDPRPEIRVSAAASMTNVPASESSAMLVELLGDADLGVRKFAVRSVSASHDASVHAKLRDLGKRESVPAIRAAATEKLRTIEPDSPIGRR